MEFKVFVAFMAVLIIVALLMPRGKRPDREDREIRLLDETFEDRPPDDDPIQTTTGESGSGFGFR